VYYRIRSCCGGMFFEWITLHTSLWRCHFQQRNSALAAAFDKRGLAGVSEEYPVRLNLAVVGLHVPLAASSEL
jgi:hypothetical protein